MEEQVLTLINISTEGIFWSLKKNLRKIIFMISQLKEFDKFIENQNVKIKEKIKDRDTHYSNDSSALNRYDMTEIYSPLNKYEKSLLSQEVTYYSLSNLKKH